MKAKVIMNTGDAFIVDKTVDEVKTLLSAEGATVVELPITKKVYDTTLSTINVDEKQNPAYKFEEGKVLVNAALVQAVVDAKEAEAEYYTGAADVATDEEEDGGEGWS